VTELVYIFLNDEETFSPLPGSLAVTEDGQCYDIRKLLAELKPDALARAWVETPESVLDELELNDDDDYEK
jgi:hypothetical protein